MLTALHLDRIAGNGRYIDIIDVAEQLGAETYGSGNNALAVMVRESPLFQTALKKLRDKPKSATDAA